MEKGSKNVDKRTEINDALKQAMKARDEIATGTLRLILAGLKERDINVREDGDRSKGISDADILSMMQTMIKQRQESAETFAKAGRPELAERENAEIEVIRRFMPQQMDDAAMRKTVEALITETGAAGMKDMGKVMAELKTRYAGQMDMARAGGVVKERLAG